MLWMQNWLLRGWGNQGTFTGKITCMSMNRNKRHCYQFPTHLQGYRTTQEAMKHTTPTGSPERRDRARHSVGHAIFFIHSPYNLRGTSSNLGFSSTKPVNRILCTCLIGPYTFLLVLFYLSRRYTQS